MVEFKLLMNRLSNRIVLLTSAHRSSEVSTPKVFDVGNNEITGGGI